MMIMMRSITVSLDKDLSAFSRYLTQYGLDHHISEEGSHQVIWVANARDAALVRALYVDHESGRLILDAVDATRPGATANTITRPGATASTITRAGLNLRQAMLGFPVTLLLIGVNLVLFLVTFASDYSDALFARLIFLPLAQAGDIIRFASLEQTMAAGELWRLFTPMLLHFGWLHLTFNLLWVWEVGRHIERINGPWILLMTVLMTSVASNLMQYFLFGPGFFGGMSGVVFGLLGYSFVWSQLVPSRDTGLPRGVYIFMLLYLVLGFTGAIDLLGLGSIANGAHLGGLVAGLVLGSIMGAIKGVRAHP